MNSLALAALATAVFSAAVSPVFAAVDDAPTATPPAVKAAEVVLPGDAKEAWKALTDAATPPLPPSEWNQKQPSEAEVKAFSAKMGAAAGHAADVAKAFLEKFPKDEHGPDAKEMRVQLLRVAAQQGDETRLAEYKKEAGQAETKNAEPSDPVVKRLNEAAAAARKLEDKGMPAVLAEFEKQVRLVLKDFPGNPEVYGALLEVAQNSDADKAKQIAQEIAASKAPEELKVQAKAMTAKYERVGKPVDLKFKAVDGRDVDLASLKGKVVLVDFWATWCGPCRAELPNVTAAYSKLHDKGFEIVGISFDQEKDALEAFTKKNAMPWPQFFDGEGWGNKFGKEFGINAIPAMWLVDKQGNLRDLEARDGLADKVEKMLAENSPAKN